MVRRNDGWTDEEMLTALDLRDNTDLTRAQIGQRLRRSKSAIIGLFNRIDKETGETDVSPHLNGTMPRRWWKR